MNEDNYKDDNNVTYEPCRFQPRGLKHQLPNCLTES